MDVKGCPLCLNLQNKTEICKSDSINFTLPQTTCFNYIIICLQVDCTSTDVLQVLVCNTSLTN